jgi:hypothetical protein
MSRFHFVCLCYGKLSRLQSSIMMRDSSVSAVTTERVGHPQLSLYNTRLDTLYIFAKLKLLV